MKSWCPYNVRNLRLFQPSGDICWSLLVLRFFQRFLPKSWNTVQKVTLVQRAALKFSADPLYHSDPVDKTDMAAPAP